MGNKAIDMREAMIMLISMGLRGCIAGANTTRLYDGDRRLSEIAVVGWDGSIPPVLLKVDGQPVPQGKLKYNRVELTAGTHTFTLRPIVGPGEVAVTHTLEAGRCYRMIQRQVESREAPEAGANMVAVQYEPPRLAEFQDPVCSMR